MRLKYCLRNGSHFVQKDVSQCHVLNTWNTMECLEISSIILNDIIRSMLELKWVKRTPHYSDVIMDAIASQITSASIVYSTVCSGPDQSKHQSSASLAFVRGIHRWPVNSPHKVPVTRKIFSFGDVIMWRANFRLRDPVTKCKTLNLTWYRLYHLCLLLISVYLIHSLFALWLDGYSRFKYLTRIFVNSNPDMVIGHQNANFKTRI